MQVCRCYVFVSTTGHRCGFPKSQFKQYEVVTLSVREGSRFRGREILRCTQHDRHDPEPRLMKQPLKFDSLCLSLRA